jgi:transcription elongation GreA/GreB family factor
MSLLPAKSDLKAELLARLTEELGVLERAHEAAREGATHEEAKPEGDKDTRALEQSYLARGQARRVEELRSAVANVAALSTADLGAHGPAALGALVIADEDDETRTFFLAPAGGGLSLAGGTVQVVTPRSPVGRALLGKRDGDLCETLGGGRTRELVVRTVR